MNDNQITYVLNNFIQYEHCFTLEDLSNFSEPEFNNELVRDALLTDSRFMQLEEGNSNKKYFISKRRLFQWFCQLSLKLAQAKQSRLSKHQLVMIMNSLCIKDRWDAPSTEVIQFGKQFGFIGSAWTDNQYIFPLAYVLSFMPNYLSKVTIKYILEDVSKDIDIINVSLPFKQLAQELVQKGFSYFRERECYIIKAREGLLTGKKMTLEWIGINKGITRERVRQIESKLWHRLRHQAHAPPFSIALIYNIMSKQGSLITTANSSEALIISFLAKCTGVPYYSNLSHIKMLILGVLPEDTILLPKSSSSIFKEIDVASIVNRWESEGRFCLIKSDLQALAENIAWFCKKPLNKGQKVYLALQTIGKPAHSAQIAEVYNSLFPDQPSTDHNIHAVLSHEKYGVVWIGVRSTFALKEWGYEHPSETLFDTVTKIVEEKYKNTNQPIPFEIIVTEMGKYRQFVNHNSLTIAAACNPNLRRIGKNSFVPKESGEETQEEILAEKLDIILREFKIKEQGELPIINIPENKKITEKPIKLPDAKINTIKKFFNYIKNTAHLKK
jgi:hypothetical protein